VAARLHRSNDLASTGTIVGATGSVGVAHPADANSRIAQRADQPGRRSHVRAHATLPYFLTPATTE